MTKKIFFLFAILAGFAMQTMAKAATPDSVFVVKNGRIVSAYEVGKDVDNITFPKHAVLEGNSVQVGAETVEMKSAVMTTQNGYVYVFLSSREGCTSTSDIMKGGKALQVTLSPSLVGKDVNFGTFDSEYNSDVDFFQVTYMDVDKYNADDNYEPVSFSAYDWNEQYADGNLSVSTSDNVLRLHFDCEPMGDGQVFAGQYSGSFTEIAEKADHFIVDGSRYELRAVFAEQKADGINFYLTPGNISNASDLDNCYYYVRLFVPTHSMDGRTLDVQGNQEYEITFVDNYTDINNPQTYNFSSDNPGSAEGTISVTDNGDGTYTIRMNIEKIGKSADRSFDIVYIDGTPLEYSLAVPSNYSVADGTPVDLKSAVLTHDAAAGLYTIYLSSKAGVTTLAGMADADIVVTLPDEFVNDDLLHGFSGAETNAKVAVTYAGDTYCQATTSTAASPIALGGNAKLSFGGGTAEVDFTVFSIKKYKGALVGHYEGSVTIL